MTLTLGELVTRRKLEKGGSREGYRPGQLSATVMGDSAAVSWVDDTGSAVVVFCTKSEDGEEWITHPQLILAGLEWIELRPVPRSLATGDKFAKAISEAARKKKGRQSPGGSKPKNGAPSDGAQESGSSA